MKYHVSFDIDLKRNPYKGKLIAIEGIDGSGKTTQVEKLVGILQKQDKDVLATKEPWDEGLIGHMIRSEILSGKKKISPYALQYLFVADRTDHLEKFVMPALKVGKTVVTDRFFWSAIPYGVLDRGEDDYNSKQVILAAYSILSFYHQFIVPDHTFYLDVSVTTAVERMEHKQYKEIYEKKEKLEKILVGYQWLLQEFKNEFIVIDAEKSVNAVTKEILSKIQN